MCKQWIVLLFCGIPPCFPPLVWCNFYFAWLTSMPSPPPLLPCLGGVYCTLEQHACYRLPRDGTSPSYCLSTKDVHLYYLIVWHGVCNTGGKNDTGNWRDEFIGLFLQIAIQWKPSSNFLSESTLLGLKTWASMLFSWSCTSAWIKWLLIRTVRVIFSD